MYPLAFFIKLNRLIHVFNFISTLIVRWLYEMKAFKDGSNMIITECTIKYHSVYAYN